MVSYCPSARCCSLPFVLLMLMLMIIVSSFASLAATAFTFPAETNQFIDMASCLAEKGVKNFSLFPNNPSQERDQFEYYKFLNFSIQNLRFAETSLPKPVAIIMPENREELMRTVLCCTEGSLEIRVRCGGHSYEGTSSVAVDGFPFVIIDLMNLDRVSVDMKSETAWVEGGATLGQTYHAISQTSRVHGFSAGSCPTVGIGGHISGGGFGLLSRKYGLAADNVVDALLIDANGRLLDREAMGEEVFWAIRGGGGGIWGIVYAWKIKVLKVPEVVTGFVVSRPGTKHHVATLVNKWQHVAPKLPGEFYLSVFVGAGLPEAAEPGVGVSATFKGFYVGPKGEALSLLENVFPELNVTEGNCTEMSWIESIVYFSGLGPGTSVSQLKDRSSPNKLFFKAKSDYVRTRISISGIRMAIEILEQEPKGQMIMDPYGGMMEELSSESIAFPHRQGNIFTIQYLVEWKEENEQKSKDYIEWIRGFYNAMTPYVSSGPRAAYINYLDLDLGEMGSTAQRIVIQQYHLSWKAEAAALEEDMVERARVWGEKYFLSNYDRLVRAKTLIDPQNIFRHQQGIPSMYKTNAKSQL